VKKIFFKIYDQQEYSQHRRVHYFANNQSGALCMYYQIVNMSHDIRVYHDKWMQIKYSHLWI
jgi:hypothetical protein